MIRRTPVALAIVLLAACSSSAPPAAPETKLPTSAQRTGDPDAGYQYLLYGNFVSSGIPLATFTQIFGSSSQDLQRTGDSAGIPYNYNVVTASNGVKVGLCDGTVEIANQEDRVDALRRDSGSVLCDVATVKFMRYKCRATVCSANLKWKHT